VIRFVVAGIPVPQGSKNPWGGEANPHLKGWRQAVADAAARALHVEPLPGPVRVQAEFVFPRPKAHYRTGRYAQELRVAAPYWHTSTPDLDKLQRAIGDALTGILVRDDAQIAAWLVSKRYGQPARAEITVTALQQADPGRTLTGDERLVGEGVRGRPDGEGEGLPPPALPA
jgi:Holliday junction resolvase RusA-like endonuclease